MYKKDILVNVQRVEYVEDGKVEKKKQQES